MVVHCFKGFLKELMEETKDVTCGVWSQLQLLLYIIPYTGMECVLCQSGNWEDGSALGAIFQQKSVQYLKNSNYFNASKYIFEMYKKIWIICTWLVLKFKEGVYPLILEGEIPTVRHTFHIFHVIHDIYLNK